MTPASIKFRLACDLLIFKIPPIKMFYCKYYIISAVKEIQINNKSPAFTCRISPVDILIKNHFTKFPRHAIKYAVDGIPKKRKLYHVYNKDIYPASGPICTYHNERDMRSGKSATDKVI